MNVPIVVSVAGSDPSGGAGIQADLKTFAALHTYGAAVLTALTAQNTRGVSDVFPVPAAFVAAQLRDVLEDLDVRAVKTGMLGSPDVVDALVDTLAAYPDIPVVVDPVMVATSGDRLVPAATVEAIRERLVPIATVLTPNLPESATLLGWSDIPPERMREAGTALRRLGSTTVVVKGGHGTGPDATDVVVGPDQITELPAPRIDTVNTHGTGCTFSSAIAARLAHGATVGDAVRTAKDYITAALEAGKDQRIGHGHGPVHHFYALWEAAHD